MNRLRDESGLDPISEKGIGMLRSVRPTSSSPGLKRRVWAAVQQTTVASPIRSRSPMLRAVVVGLGLVAFTATAAATIGGRRIAARLEKFLGARAGIAEPRSDWAKPVRVMAEVQTPSATATVAPPPVSFPSLPSTSETRAPLSPPPAVRAVLRPSRAVPLATETSRERAQVWEALVALRRDHDPNRAAALLNHDLETNRHGVLRQEALVLAIEAADARSDRRGAERFAHAYQQEFPSGRFNQFVRSYLEVKNPQVRSLPSMQ